MKFKVDVKVHPGESYYGITGMVLAQDIEAALDIFRQAIAAEKGVAMDMLSPGSTFFPYELLKGCLIQIAPMEEETA